MKSVIFIPFVLLIAGCDVAIETAAIYHAWQDESKSELNEDEVLDENF